MDNLPIKCIIKLSDILGGKGEARDEEFADDLVTLVLDYLSDKFGYCIESFILEDGELRITDLTWDTEE